MTAGGTAEPIDPVRFIGNRSTGRMGIAIARAALDRGARVTLVAGRLEVEPPAGVDRGPGRDHRRHAARRPRSRARPARRRARHGRGRRGLPARRRAAATKLTRDAPLTLELEPTEDILAEVGTRARDLDPRPVIVGFAAETGSLDRAPDKLRRKGADLLVANDVAEPGSGFGTETNRVSILGRDGSRDDLPLLEKRDVADRLLDRVVALLDERRTGEHTGATSTETIG